MKSYPIEEAKIQALMNSINETGFWDNIVARKSDGHFQIAYGHHRLLALRKIFKPTDTVDIPVKDFDDATMIRIMANENDATWGINVKVDDETVRAAKEFLEKNPEIAKKYLKGRGALGGGRLAPTGPKVGYAIIYRFLGKNWYKRRVKGALERLNLYENGLSRKAVHMLPTEGTVRTFVKAVKEIKPDLETQEKVAKAIAEADKKDGLTSPAVIQRELLQETLIKKGIISEKRKADKTKDFLGYIEECAKLVRSLSGKIHKLIDFKKDFDSEFYFQTFERFDFITSAKTLVRKLDILIGEKNEEIKKLNN
jgi:ParB-like chromosome segregation protein Spo0J